MAEESRQAAVQGPEEDLVQPRNSCTGSPLLALAGFSWSCTGSPLLALAGCCAQQVQQGTLDRPPTSAVMLLYAGFLQLDPYTIQPPSSQPMDNCLLAPPLSAVMLALAGFPAYPFTSPTTLQVQPRSSWTCSPLSAAMLALAGSIVVADVADVAGCSRV
eukprot:gene13156-3482_t